MHDMRISYYTYLYCQLVTFCHFKRDAFEEMAQAELHRFEQGVMEDWKMVHSHSRHSLRPLSLGQWNIMDHCWTCGYRHGISLISGSISESQDISSGFHQKRITLA